MTYDEQAFWASMPLVVVLVFALGGLAGLFMQHLRRSVVTCVVLAFVAMVAAIHYEEWWAASWAALHVALGLNDPRDVALGKKVFTVVYTVLAIWAYAAVWVTVMGLPGAVWRAYVLWLLLRQKWHRQRVAAGQ